MSRRLYTLALLPAVAVAGQAVAQEITLDSVDQRIRILERKIELDKEAADAAAKSATTPAAAASGFSLASGDKGYTLNFKFTAQLDARRFFNDDSLPTGGNGGDTFTLRRVRPILTGTVGKLFEFNLTPEFGTNPPSVVNIWGQFRLNPAFNVKVGKYTLPVVLEPGDNRHFNESPFTNSLAPNRDIGIEINGAPGAYVEYRIGVFNGARDDANGNDVIADTDSKKELVGRLTLKPLAGTDGFLKTLALSVGASTGKEDGTTTNTGLGSIASVSRRTFFSYGSTNTVNGRRTRLSPGVTLYSGPFSLLSEYITEKADYLRGTNAFDAKNQAWRATAGWVLTGESSSGSVNPKKPFTAGGEGWGAFEVAAFASGIQFGDELFSNAPAPNGAIDERLQARNATEFGLAGNWYLTRNVSVRLNLEQTRFHKNYRRDPDGGTATITSPVADTEKAASVRFQVQF